MCEACWREEDRKNAAASSYRCPGPGCGKKLARRTIHNNGATKTTRCIYCGWVETVEVQPEPPKPKVYNRGTPDFIFVDYIDKLAPRRA